MTELKKITDLDALAQVAAADCLLIIDVSEPFDADKAKKITFENLVNLAAQTAVQALISSQQAGDIFYASSASALGRLAKGAAGAILKQGVSVPAWIAPGAEGDVLTIDSGVPAWGSLTIENTVKKRQGGSATNWFVYGESNYTPTNAIIQTGITRFNFYGEQSVIQTITFPEAFDYTPLFYISAGIKVASGSLSGATYSFITGTPTTSNVSVTLSLSKAGMSVSIDVCWMAIGPKA